LLGPEQARLCLDGINTAYSEFQRNGGDVIAGGGDNYCLLYHGPEPGQIYCRTNVTGGGPNKVSPYSGPYHMVHAMCAAVGFLWDTAQGSAAGEDFCQTFANALNAPGETYNGSSIKQPARDALAVVMPLVERVKKLVVKK
jgi:hypothetical protein